MKSIGDRLERWEKAKRGNLWDWIKSKMIAETGLAQWVEHRPAD